MASHVKSDESGTVEKDGVLAGQTARENITETDSFNQSVFSLDPNEEFKMDHKKRGMALIFNHERFYWQLMLNSRSGTEADKQNLVRRFQGLGFEVKAYDNYKREEVLSKIREAKMPTEKRRIQERKKQFREAAKGSTSLQGWLRKSQPAAAAANHVDADCFVCVFLSHGENGHIYAYDGQIEIQEITDLFKGDKCRSLVGKPKIFIFQACRGDKHDEPVTPMDVVDSQTVNEVVVDAGALCTLPAGADFLMCYSVAEGFFSHREMVNGSWYIQDLCEILRHHGSTLEFTDILTLVNRKVSFRSVGISNDRSALGKKQVPCFASMLTKKLFFRPKKEH